MILSLYMFSICRVCTTTNSLTVVNIVTTAGYRSTVHICSQTHRHMYAFALLQNPPKVQVLLVHVSLKAICRLLSGGGYILLLREDWFFTGCNVCGSSARTARKTNSQWENESHTAGKEDKSRLLLNVNFIRYQYADWNEWHRGISLFS